MCWYFDFCAAVSPVLALPDRQMVQSAGTNALLTCLVHAFPPAELHWVHADAGDGRIPTIGNEKYRVQNWTVDEHSILFGLNIFSIAAADYGTYYCRARNEFGEDGAKLVVYGKIVHSELSTIGLRRWKQANTVFDPVRLGQQLMFATAVTPMETRSSIPILFLICKFLMDL